MAYKYTETFEDGNVVFNNISQPNIQTGNRVASGAYTVDDDGNITKTRQVVQAIDIDWLRAQIPGVEGEIRTSGQLLHLIGQLKQAIESGSLPDNLLERLNSIEEDIESMKNSGTSVANKYYWYIGTANPALMTYIMPIDNDAAVNNNWLTGWREIGEELPTATTYNEENKLWDGNNVIGNLGGYIIYIAVPYNPLEIYDEENNKIDWVADGQTIINGKTYYIYKSPIGMYKFEYNIFNR